MKNKTLAVTYFLLSTIITWWFIKQAELLYFSKATMFLSCNIAGAKWAIQILAGWFFLQEKKWLFIKRIGFTCFIGSCVLLPYCLFYSTQLFHKFFLWSIIAAVFTMIPMYYYSVKKTGISTKWFWGWMSCLVIAVSLQLFVVFKLL